MGLSGKATVRSITGRNRRFLLFGVHLPCVQLDEAGKEAEEPELWSEVACSWLSPAPRPSPYMATSVTGIRPSTLPSSVFVLLPAAAEPPERHPVRNALPR